MTAIQQDPISIHWTAASDQSTAREVASRLGAYRVSDLGDAELQPFLAAAAAELASAAGLRWRFATDDAPVALLRIIARAAIAAPEVAGPHSARLLAHLPAPGSRPRRS